MKIESIAAQVFYRVPHDKWVEAHEIKTDWFSNERKLEALSALVSEGAIQAIPFYDEADEQPIIKYRRPQVAKPVNDDTFKGEVSNAFERIGTPVQMHNRIVDAVLGKGDLFSALCDITRTDAERLRKWDMIENDILECEAKNSGCGKTYNIQRTKDKALTSIPHSEWEENQRQADLEYAHQMSQR